ncbi:MAG: 30S ribosomal protein S8 [Polyangiaceae bacterium UTPRO1]|jgi:small subunit ribosomal protein S8|nr:30S ribosomal protein S8 [Myxococcales bacterium]OQY65892.1 MAG: 30S ribosomal protein S8 [Polyangiaceae bacterium UTPRO1]
MSMTDPIADLLTRIRNGNRARKERVDVPWSALKEAVARVLIAEGFLRDVAVVGEGTVRQLRLMLKYDDQRRPVISGLQRVSRPSLRVYVGKEEIPSVRGGLGINVLSTPAGVLVDREAKQRGVGGELLCSVW